MDRERKPHIETQITDRYVERDITMYTYIYIYTHMYKNADRERDVEMAMVCLGEGRISFYRTPDLLPAELSTAYVTGLPLMPFSRSKNSLSLSCFVRRSCLRV